MKAINEINLNLKQLDVQRDDDKKRGDLLLAKIRDSEPIVVNKSGERKEIVVVNVDQIVKAVTNRDGSYNSFRSLKYFTNPNNEKRYREDAILGDDGTYYKLNDIEKTSYFGSTRGASLGSIDTRFVESIICVFLAWRQLKSVDLDESDIEEVLNMDGELFEDFKARYTGLDNRLTLKQEDIERYLDTWSYSFINIPNYLYHKGIVYSGFKNDYLISENKTYRFCQLSSSSGVVKALRSKFQERHPGVNFAKWNPSDIFAVELRKEAEIERSLYECKSNARLNEIIDYSFDERIMVGISLKKVTQSSDLKIVVNKVTRPPKYTLNTIRLSRLPFATLGLEIIANRKSRQFGEGTEVMVIRSKEKSKLVNISGEVRGKTAKHGAMSLTQINKILDYYGLEKVPGIRMKTEKYYGEAIEMWSDAELKREILAINKKIIEYYGSIIDSKKLAIEVDRVRLISKYQSLFLAWILMQASEIESEKEGLSIADQVIEDMFHFALSINITPGKESGRTPRYARLID